MPKTVQIRVSFQNDIAFLSRLSQAIEKDPYMLPVEKQQAVYHLNATSKTLHEVEGRRMTDAMNPPEGEG